MKRRAFLGICRSAALACASWLAVAPSTAGASDQIPSEMVIDGEPVRIDDPYCPTCYLGPPSVLVIEDDTEATLTLHYGKDRDEPVIGTLLVEVDLDDGRTIRVHREWDFELSADRPVEVTLYAGPDWTWHSVVEARAFVVQDWNAHLDATPR